MTKPIYASQEHKIIIESYILMCIEFAKDVSNKTRYNNYLDVLETIIEYHNSYGKGRREENFYDWLVIIPINLSVATNGFFAGIETNNNRSVVRAYKTVLNELVGEVVDKIDKLEQTDE
jgi:hypothetical protein|tara:strand:+ start:280 stop:636 length:357 start_codon:yes stop_codon:yes gene_type:complete